VQRDVAALKDGPGADGEVELALIAAVEAGLTGRDAILTGAGWASNAFRPEARLQVEPRCLFIGKHLEKLEGADCRAGHLLNLRRNHRGQIGRQKSCVCVSDAKLNKLAFTPGHGGGRISPASDRHVFTSVLDRPFRIAAHTTKAAEGLERQVISEEFDARAVGVNAADCGVLDDSFDVGHGGHPFRLFRRLSAFHVFKVVDSRANVKKKMRKSCGQGN
jgi:hypothetical protein